MAWLWHGHLHSFTIGVFTFLVPHAVFFCSLLSKSANIERRKNLYEKPTFRSLEKLFPEYWETLSQTAECGISIQNEGYESLIMAKRMPKVLLSGPFFDI
jgi:hypothetical protein